MTTDEEQPGQQAPQEAESVEPVDSETPDEEPLPGEQPDDIPFEQAAAEHENPELA